MSQTIVLRLLELERECAKRAADVMKAVRIVLNSHEMRCKEQARLQWTITQFSTIVSECFNEDVSEELYLTAIRH